MNSNPLFPTNDMPSSGNSYLLPKQKSVIQPLQDITSEGANPAVDLIRQKLARIFAEEPDASEEAREAQVTQPRSKHQQFMYDLTTSGKSLADIQTEWHNYYVALPDEEKHQVWQEFYESSNLPAPQKYGPGHRMSAPKTAVKPPLHRSHAVTPTHTQPAPESPAIPPNDSDAGIVVSKPALSLPALNTSSLAQLRRRIRHKVTAGGRLGPRHHLQSLLFGLTAGAAVLVIFLFSFFNEVVIAPFVQPARTASATPIIVDPSTITPSSTPEIIIPKINLEIPVDFSQTSTNEATIESALENGIVHYPSTVLPGQAGNAAFFGHSSNNIFNPGKYKFAFVLLHELVPGDTFYITYNSKVYIYKVFDKRIVAPSEVGVLSNVPDHVATATLITCDPPGTSLNRLIVVGEQISPDPSTNAGGNNTSQVSVDSPQLPGNGPTLLSRFWNWLF